MSAHEAHEKNVSAIHEMISGAGPEDHAERERLLWLLCGIHAGALTPVSENEKRGMERVLAILDRKLAEGGGSTDDDHNRFYRGRWSAFRECAIMLRAALAAGKEEGRSSIEGAVLAERDREVIASTISIRDHDKIPDGYADKDFPNHASISDWSLWLADHIIDAVRRSRPAPDKEDR